MNLPGSPTRRELLLLLALGVTVLPAVFLFLKPPANPQIAAFAPPVVAPVPPPEAGSEPVPQVDELAKTAQAVLLPDLLQTSVNLVRKQGKTPWMADAIEIAWTRGFSAAVEHLKGFLSADQLDENSANLLALLVQEKLEFLGEGLPLIHDPNHRSGVTSSSISLWARKDPMRLAVFAREHLDGEVKNNAFDGVIKALARKGRFVEATAVLSDVPQSETRMRMNKSLAAEWGRKDFDGAFAWARAFSPGADQLALEQSLIFGAGTKLTLERMHEIAGQFATEQTRPLWDSVIGGKLLATDADAAIAWANTLPPESRRRFQSRIAPKLAQSDLARGTAFALRIDDEVTRIRAIETIQRELTRKSIQDTIGWAATLPDEFQPRAISGIVMSWYRTDEEATKSWVTSLPASRRRDLAAMWLTWEVAWTDTAAAKALANSINDPELKESALTNMPRPSQRRAVVE